MGRIQKGPNNNAIDVPWDHYTFDLGGHTDLQPQLRKQVEIIETEVGFCMLYPKRRGKGKKHSEGRDPNATLHRNATFDSSEGGSPDKAWQTSRRAAISPSASPTSSPKQKHGQQSQQHSASRGEIHQILAFEENRRQLLQCSYSSRSFR